MFKELLDLDLSSSLDMIGCCTRLELGAVFLKFKFWQEALGLWVTKAEGPHACNQFFPSKTEYFELCRPLICRVSDSILPL